MELVETTSANILRGWQHLYFKILHLSEELHAGHWDIFLNDYKSYSKQFEIMKSKNCGCLSKIENELVNDIINKIKNANLILIDEVNKELSHTASQIGKLKSGMGQSCDYGI